MPRPSYPRKMRWATTKLRGQTSLLATSWSWKLAKHGADGCEVKDGRRAAPLAAREGTTGRLAIVS